MMRFVAFALFLAVGCNAAKAAPLENVIAPPREIWLPSTQAQGFTTEPATTLPIDAVVRTTGKVAFDETRVAHVFSAASGRVTRIDAQLGQKVKKGDVLAVLRSPDIGSATSDLAKAKADEVAARRDFDRKEGLYEEHAASQADVETAQDTFERDEAEVTRAKQRTDLFDVGGGVTSDFVIRAPISGEIVARGISPGIEVQGQYAGGTSTELFTIGDISAVWMTGDVYELDLPRVIPGAIISAHTAAYPQRTFTGTVDWVSKSIDPATHAARMRCRIPNSDDALVPEMALAVDVGSGREMGIVLPAAAVIRVGDDSVVFVDRGDIAGKTPRRRFTAVTVDVSALPDGRVRILRGLTESDRVVTKNAILLAGML